MSKFKCALLLALACAGGVHAAQVTRASCSVDGGGGANLISNTPAQGWRPITGIGVTLNNAGTVDKKAYLHFAADTGVPPDAEVRLGFSIDGAAPVYLGPQNLANAVQYYQSRSTLAVVTVPPGRHTVRPFWFVSGAGAELGVMDDRCLFVTF